MVSTKRSGLKCLVAMQPGQQKLYETGDWPPKKLGVVHYWLPPTKLVCCHCFGWSVLPLSFHVLFWVKLFWVKSTLDSHEFPQTYFRGLLTVNHVAQSKTLLWTNHTGGYLPTKIIMIQVRGGCILHLGWNIPGNAGGFLEQLGCTQAQRPLPLQKRPDPDCIAVNANFLDADSVPLPQEDSLVDNRD